MPDVIKFSAGVSGTDVQTVVQPNSITERGGDRQRAFRARSQVSVKTRSWLFQSHLQRGRKGGPGGEEREERKLRL